MNTITISSLLEDFTPFFDATITNFIGIETEDKILNINDLDIEKSKIGGTPYWPTNKDYPLIFNKPAKLVAQINFSQLSEQGITLPDFPQNGILQFYSPNNDIFLGSNLDKTSDIKVVYHEHIGSYQVTNVIKEISENNINMPFKKELSLHFFNAQEYLGHKDLMAVERFNMDLTAQLQDDNEPLMEYYANNIYNGGSKLGGYAYFTQRDFRDDPNLILLFQIDTDDNLMWGDAGIANWFITKEDLLARNFDNVVFSWDCC